jgi:hypothetical protein
MSTPRSILSRASVGEFDFLGSHVGYSFGDEWVWCRRGARLRRPSSYFTLDHAHDVASFMIRRSSPSILTSVPDHLPNRTRSPLHVERDELAGLVAAARADGDDLALLGLFLGGVRNDDAALGLLFFLDALDDDAVVQRTELHGDCKGRALTYAVTEKGRAAIEAAIPYWRVAQDRIEGGLGQERWSETRDNLKAIRRAARQAG